VSEQTLGGESGPESSDASGSDRWRGRLNSLVASVQTFWEHITVGPGHIGDVRVSDPYEVDVPVAMRIDFAAGPVWMVAGSPQHPEMREVFVPGDEIMVVFTAERMRTIGFSLFRDPGCQLTARTVAGVIGKIADLATAPGAA